MWIKRYDLTTLAEIDQFDLSGLEGGDFSQIADPAYGLSVDGTSKAYAVDYSGSLAVRADIATLLGDLLVGSFGSGDENFAAPTYSAIVSYSPPIPPTPVTKTFGYITW